MIVALNIAFGFRQICIAPLRIGVLSVRRLVCAFVLSDNGAVVPDTDHTIDSDVSEVRGATAVRVVTTVELVVFVLLPVNGYRVDRDCETSMRLISPGRIRKMHPRTGTDVLLGR